MLNLKDWFSHEQAPTLVALLGMMLKNLEEQKEWSLPSEQSRIKDRINYVSRLHEQAQEMVRAGYRYQAKKEAFSKIED